MEFDPYRPPSVDAQGPITGTIGNGEPLFTAQHVALGTFFGTPLAGFILMGLNETRMGRPAELPKMVGFGILAGAVMLGIALIVPDGFPSFTISLGSVFGMQALAKHVQGEEVGQRLAVNVPKASGWHAFGIGLLSLLPLMVGAFAVAWLFPGLVD